MSTPHKDFEILTPFSAILVFLATFRVLSISLQLSIPRGDRPIPLGTGRDGGWSDESVWLDTYVTVTTLDDQPIWPMNNDVPYTTKEA